MPAQKIEEGRGVAVARAEMQIGDPGGAITSRRNEEFSADLPNVKSLLRRENSL